MKRWNSYRECFKHNKSVPCARTTKCAMLFLSFMVGSHFLARSQFFIFVSVQIQRESTISRMDWKIIMFSLKETRLSCLIIKVLTLQKWCEVLKLSFSRLTNKKLVAKNKFELEGPNMHNTNQFIWLLRMHASIISHEFLMGCFQWYLVYLILISKNVNTMESQNCSGYVHIESFIQKLSSMNFKIWNLMLELDFCKHFQKNSSTTNSYLVQFNFTSTTTPTHRKSTNEHTDESLKTEVPNYSTVRTRALNQRNIPTYCEFILTCAPPNFFLHD